MSATRYLLDVLEDGEFVLVEGGSSGEALKYEIAGDDIPTVALWLPSSQVQIRPSRSKQFPARIYNVSEEESVKAIPLGPVPYSPPRYE